jgi:glyoxylate reductase
MKRGVVIVNTARGGVMDEDALVKALESGQVWSVGLDVYQQEPNIHSGLVSNPHVCLLPHMGTSTVEVSAREYRSDGPCANKSSRPRPRWSFACSATVDQP